MVLKTKKSMTINKNHETFTFFIKKTNKLWSSLQ